MCNIDCPHLANCINAHKECCQRCEHNKNHKVDYFRPVPQPYYPYNPWYPVWITCPTWADNKTDYYITYTSSTNNPTITTTQVSM